MMGEEIRHFQKVFGKTKKHPMDIGFVCNKGFQTTTFQTTTFFGKTTTFLAKTTTFLK
jgi:hypothetical protein